MRVCVGLNDVHRSVDGLVTVANETIRKADELIRALGMLALAQERSADGGELERLSSFVDQTARAMSGDWRGNSDC